MSKLKNNIVVVGNKQQISGMSAKITPVSSHLFQADVEIEPKLTNIIYNETINRFQNKKIRGFSQQNIPKHYLEKNFNKEIKDKVGNYLLEFHVTDFLLKEIIKQKIHLSNYPRFSHFVFSENNLINFIFNISTSDNIELREWNLLSFKPPIRKKYKDLDKQVYSFMENEFFNKKCNKNIIEQDDWVCFNAQLINDKKELLFPEKKSLFWMKIKNEEITSPLKQELLGKNIHDKFVTNNINQNCQERQESTCNYNFLITVESTTKWSQPSLESFKIFFKLKNKNEVHNKLIEIFSYRNNQSQRKLIIEELFRLLLNKNRFDIPKHLIIRRQEDLMFILRKKSDYQIYKQEKNFLGELAKLSEMQIKEEVIIDQISSKEKISVSIEDIACYLNLFSNKRLKEFIYFKPILESLNDGSLPINSYLLEQTVLREKMLNHIIYSIAS